MSQRDQMQEHVDANAQTHEAGHRGACELVRGRRPHPGARKHYFLVVSGEQCQIPGDLPLGVMPELPVFRNRPPAGRNSSPPGYSIAAPCRGSSVQEKLDVLIITESVRARAP